MADSSNTPRQPDFRRGFRRSPTGSPSRIGAALAVGLLCAAALALSLAGSDTDVDATGPLDVPTVQVERRDLVVEHEATGNLEQAGSLEVVAPTGGILVEASSGGTEIETGTVLAVVDDRPIVALPGETPAWRDLAVGDEGEDVAQLEAALVGAGFDPDGLVAVDEEYTSATASMVEEWQASSGTEPTGVVALGSVVFVESETRVETVEAGVGATVNDGDVLLVLATIERVVRADIPVADASSLHPGAVVAVRLPDRTTLDGTLLSRATGSDPSTVSLLVGVDPTAEPDADLAGLGAVDVTLIWSETVALDVPTLPAGAFRKLDDGTYVVDLVDGNGLSAVTIEPGRQVDGRVEVVGVPRDVDVVSP